MNYISLILCFLTISYCSSLPVLPEEVTTLISKNNGFLYRNESPVATESFSQFLSINVIVDVCNTQLLKNIKQMKNLEKLIFNFNLDLGGSCDNSMLGVSGLYLKHIKHITIEEPNNYSLNSIRKVLVYVENRLQNIKEIKFSKVLIIAEQTEDEELKDFIKEIKSQRKAKVILNLAVVTYDESFERKEMIINILKDLSMQGYFEFEPYIIE